MRYCQKHPKIETMLGCSRCDTSICPKCMVSGSVGYLCPTCAAVGKDPLFTIPLWRLGLTIVAGLLAGLFGQLVLYTTGHKRGRRVEWLTGGSLLGGAVLSTLVNGQWERYLHNPISAAMFLLAIFVTCGAAIARVRHW
jgi:uncharacterized membrane protein